jgi:hypothetical protein
VLCHRAERLSCIHHVGALEARSCLPLVAEPCTLLQDGSPVYGSPVRAHSSALQRVDPGGSSFYLPLPEEALQDLRQGGAARAAGSTQPAASRAALQPDAHLSDLALSMQKQLDLLTRTVDDLREVRWGPCALAACVAMTQLQPAEAHLQLLQQPNHPTGCTSPGMGASKLLSDCPSSRVFAALRKLWQLTRGVGVEVPCTVRHSLESACYPGEQLELQSRMATVTEPSPATTACQSVSQSVRWMHNWL